VEDAVVPVSELPRIIHKIEVLSRKYDLKVGVLTHAGDGNLQPDIMTDVRNKEEKYFEEFNRCAKCGMCLAQCPVYKVSLLEKASPRGKIQLAKFYKEGRGTLSERYRERCLLCGACATVCPSGMKAHEIVLRMRE